MENQNTGYVLKLSQPYAFGGRSYAEIDLSGMENMTAADMIAAEAYMIHEGLFTTEKEDTLEYSFFIASRFSGLPMQFFMQFKPKDAARLRAAVKEYMGSDADEGSGERHGKNK